ncbi:MAG: hypothetical protein GF365_01390|nr:hypothetical protein [Candidatus Buchananbacteria bacterium]
MELHLGLENQQLYKGCEVTEVAGRMTLTTPVEEAVNIVGRNIKEIVDATEDREEIVLTGPMAVWSYLVVFHAVVHSFKKVFYADGKGDKVLIAMH